MRPVRPVPVINQSISHTLERTRLRWALMTAPLLCLLAAPAVAQKRPYQVDHWTTDNGLPQNTVRAIVRTRDGYLWLTTFDGLARFDGVHFTVFDKRNTPAITNNRFTALYEDRDGALWAGADEGEVVVYRHGAFSAYPMPATVRGAVVSTFIRDAQDQLMVVTPAGFYNLHRQGPVLAPRDYTDERGLIYRGPSGTQWTIDARSVRRSRNGDEASYPLSFDWGQPLSGLGAYEDGQGNLWLTDGSRVYRLRDGRITRYTERDGLPPRTTLRPHVQDADGGVWFSLGGLFQDGAGVVRFKDERFTVYSSDAGLPVTSYLQVITDREGSIWIASSSGLFRLRPKPITVYSTAQGLLHNEVYPLLQTRDGRIAVGTTHGLSMIANGAVLPQPAPPFREVVQSLWEDRRGRLWIGGLAGLYRYDSGTLEELIPPSVTAEVWAIREDRAGALWVGTFRGLIKLERDRVVEHFTTHDGLPSDDIKVIHESTEAAGQTVLWIGTSGGLVRLDNGRFTSFTTANGLAGNRVRSIYEDADGTLWIGTYDDGLSRFRDGTFFNYRTEQGLYNNGVFQILEDRHANFWISSNKGIYRVSRRELNEMADGHRGRITSVAFGKADGMLNSECNGGRQPAGLVDRDGRLWFPTMGGVVAVDPDAAAVNPLPPPVLVESVMLGRAAIEFNQGVRVEPGQRDLEIAYTGLSLIKSDQVRFRYKLDGLNDDWVDAGTRRVAYFPYLSPGTYTFQVIAANSDGIWNDTAAALRIVVMAPFYRTAWFITLTVLGLLVAGHWAYRSRIAQLRRRQEAQAAFSRRLIESQEAERKRIAAELHDSLGQSLLVIKNRALIGGMAPDQPTVKEQFDEISQAASQAIDDARQIAYDLRPYHLDRLGLTQSLEEMIERVAASTSIHFTVNLPLLDGVFTKDGEAIFYRIVQESVSNIVKHSGTNEAVVEIRREEETVTLTIRDSGRGFTPPGSSATGGFGLIGLAERVQMLGGAYTLHTAPGRGTTITVTVPVR